MKCLVCAVSLFCCLAAVTPTAALSQDGPSEWVELFDGKTLDGWVKRGGQATFIVDNGTILGQTAPNTPNTFLCTEQEFSNFHLEFEFLVHPELNSGVQFRSLSKPDYRNGRVHGYQCEIDPSDRGWTAGIYDESRKGWIGDLQHNRAARYAFRQNRWNHVLIEAIDDRLRTWINGVPAADINDSQTASGFIALQVHGVGARQDPVGVQWRNIRIRENPEPRPESSVFIAGAEIRKLADGFRFTEGPALGPDGRIYFNDIPNSRTHVYDPFTGDTAVYRENTGRANGMYFTAADALIVCEGGNRKLVRHADGLQKVLAAEFDGKKLNSPNDLVIDGAGGIYFTDPRYGNRDDLEQDVEAVYYYSRRGNLTRVDDQMTRPNGLILSPDNRILYVADLGEKTTWAFDVVGEGQLKHKRKFCDVGSDGMTIDRGGNVYVTTEGAVIAFSPDGREIGRIHPPEAPANCLLVGNKLYITARTGFYVVQVHAQGLD